MSPFRDRPAAKRLSTALFVACLSACSATGAEDTADSQSTEALRQLRVLLLESINSERLAAGTEALQASSELDAAATAKALGVQKAAPSFEVEPRELAALAPAGDLETLLGEAGYEASRAAVHLVVVDSASSPTVATLFDGIGGIPDDLLDSDYEELGIGLAGTGRLQILAFVPARSRASEFAAATAGLGDVDRVRRKLLQASNAARGEGRGQPLIADSCLEAAAQEYAERMIAEGFYGHVSPDGGELDQRVRAAGCRRRTVAENLAMGPVEAGEVIAGWLDSPGHRRNLLDRKLRRVGFGVAYGKSGGEYRILWVQVLAAR